MNDMLSTTQADMILGFFTPEIINRIVVSLQNAEDGLDKAAFENDKLSYMFRFAYELRQIRKEVEEIERKLGYEPDRDQ